MSENPVRTFYDDHARQCAPTDFWSQVKRTINGRPVPQDQIDMIVAAIIDGLQLGADDLLLDLCCGNGALTTSLFRLCRGGLGVDFSEPLIQVAKRHFVTRIEEDFELRDVIAYLGTTPALGFTKVLCYGALQCLPNPDAGEFLALLEGRFAAVRRVFLGNLPNKERLADFYATRDDYAPGIEDSNETPIGIWRTPDEFRRLAAKAGWQAEIRTMPSGFYAAHYRYDAILTRR